MVQEVQSKHN